VLLCARGRAPPAPPRAALRLLPLLVRCRPRPTLWSRGHLRSSAAARRMGLTALLLLPLALLCVIPAAVVSIPLPNELPAHPRLILTAAHLDQIHANVKAEPLAAQLYSDLLLHAGAIANSHHSSGGRASGVRDVAYTMGLAYRLTKNASIGRAGVEAFLQIAKNPDICGACKDSNCSGLEQNCPGQHCAQNTAQRTPDPLCFGTAGEGLAVGLDWLWEAMTADERELVKRTITTQILNVYSQGLSRWYTSSYAFRAADNFNSVVNSGAMLAALAVLDEPNGQWYGNTGRFARDTLQVALLALPHGATSIYPDGSYPEGPGYGDFAISHHIQAVRAFETTLGTSAPTINVSGLAEVPRYYIDIGATGLTPSGATFNWADGGTGKGSWLPVVLSNRYANAIQPGLIYAARQTIVLANSSDGCQGARLPPPRKGEKRPKLDGEPSCAMMLADFNGRGTRADLDVVEPSHSYPGTAVAVLRSSWSNDGVWCGVKGGDNSLQQIGKGTTHTHADQGSFVLDMAGARWAEDLGADNYYDYGYFSLQKFDWYAASTAGHNTLSFSGLGQDACMDSFPALLPSGWMQGELTPVKTASTHCRAALAEFNASAGERAFPHFVRPF
jgi:hypothetical protein